jgi:transposase
LTAGYDSNVGNSPCLITTTVDDRRVISGIIHVIYVIRNGLMWRDAPIAYNPHKTFYNRFER